MKNGILRFEHFLGLLQDLLSRSSKQKNPGLWLYQNNVRTPLFMLEGLAKLYAGIHHKKRFVKLDQQFKLLEDILGAIDYYDVFAKEFAGNKKIPVPVTAYMQAQTREKIQQLNEVLIEQKWLGTINDRIKRIRKKLADTNWMDEKKEIMAIDGFYRNSIKTIVDFGSRSDFHFSNVESDIHELRRKLRWLSIYLQALRGSIQLSLSKSQPKYLKKYLVNEIITSPFNIMPDASDNRHFLLLEKNHFYALSWMVAELGKIKDNGLRIIAIKEALIQTKTISEAGAFKEAYDYAGDGQQKLEQLLGEADKLCKTYFSEQTLQCLVVGIAAVK